MGGKDDVLSLSALDIFSSARTLRASVYGSSDPDREVPELARAVLDGSLDVSGLVTHRIALDEAPEAFARMARGEGARSVVVFDD
jgi:S-(hydroxymethyl)glutathione dehydrogenase/alcohol dehydrogenase